MFRLIWIRNLGEIFSNITPNIVAIIYIYSSFYHNDKKRINEKKIFLKFPGKK